MSSATVTSKGQVTIPAEIRKQLELKPGDRIDFVKNEQGKFVLHPKNQSVRRLKGILKNKLDRTLTVEEMNQAIAERGAHLR